MSKTTTPKFCAIELQQLAAALSDVDKSKAIVNALAAEGRAMRSASVRTLRSSGIHVTPGLEKTIRGGVTRTGKAAYLTVYGGNGRGGIARRGIYYNHRGQGKPVLQFLNGSTEEERQTRYGISRAPANRGVLRKIDLTDGVIDKHRSTIERKLQQAFDKQIVKLIVKYGYNDGY